MPVRSKKPTASRKTDLGANLDHKVKLLRKQLSLANEALNVVMDLVGLKPVMDDKPKTSPAPKAARTTKAKPGPKPKAKPGPKPKAKPGLKPKPDKVKPAPKKQAKLAAKPKAKPKAKPASGRRTAAAPKVSKTSALLRVLRTKAGLSQKSLADKLSTSQNTISLLESGKQKPNVDMAIKLGQILGTPFQDLMK